MKNEYAPNDPSFIYSVQILWIQTLGIGSNLGTAGEWPSLRVQEGDYLLDGEVFELDSSSSYRGVKID